MSKKIYLILFVILCLNGWGVRFIPHLSSTTWLVVQVFYLLFGYVHWSRIERNQFGKGYLGVFVCIVLGIVLSMIPAWLYYEQGFRISIIAYRRQILWLTIPVLLRIAPSEDDIVGAIKVIVLLIWGVLLMRMFAPGLLYVNEDVLEEYQETGYYGYIIGFTLAVIPLYYSVERVLSNGLGNKKDIFWIIVCFALLFVMRNRSILFASSIVIFVSILRMQSRNKPIIIFMAILVVGMFLSATYDIWMALLSRTQIDLSDEDYNRNVAYTYFLTEANQHLLQYFLGHGYISSHVSSIVENLQMRGIYNSDVGFVGFWNEYGFLPIIAFTYMSLRALFDKVIPSYVGMIGLTILLCAPTISYFGNISHALMFMIMYILVCYYHYQSKLVLECDTIVEG